MKRKPNLWILLPSLGAGAVAAWLGATVTAITCRYRELDGTIVTCPGWTAVAGVVSFLVVFVGVAVVLVLVARSWAEWRDRSGPGEDEGNVVAPETE